MTPTERQILTEGLAGARGAPSATTGVDGEMAGIRRIELPVAGLTCPACVQTVERALRAVPGVARAVVNLAQGRAFGEYDPGEASVSALHDAIKAAGYRSEEPRPASRSRGSPARPASPGSRPRSGRPRASSRRA